jgi:hypothetical protein
MTNNPFNKPFNTWTIDDFQDALKITWAKQDASKATPTPVFIGLPIPPTIDVVELERGEPIVTEVIKAEPKQPKSKDTKHTRMKAFHAELQAFINTLQGKNGRLDVKTIKRAIDRLPRTHSLHTTYRAYLEKCNWNSRQRQLERWGTTRRFWDLTDYNRISNHLKYMNRHYTELAYTKKRSWGGPVKVYKNYIATLIKLPL